MSDLVERLRIVSNMINLGERISWGRETTLMDEAAAELTRLRARIANGLKWCDMMDGPVSKSQFVNGQATAAQQIRAALSAYEGEKG